VLLEKTSSSAGGEAADEPNIRGRAIISTPSMRRNITRRTEAESRAHVRCKHERALVSVVCGAYSQEYVIDSLVGLWCGRKFLPATATTGMDVGFRHVDVVEVKKPIFGSHENLNGELV
jgi:hypothetical protein